MIDETTKMLKDAIMLPHLIQLRWVMSINIGF
jgi:hypothetical protein